MRGIGVEADYPPARRDPFGQQVQDPARAAAEIDRALPRPEPHFSVPFGWGMHHCLGATLAEVEMEEALRLLTESYQDVRVTGVPAMTPPAGMLHGPESMLLQFAKRRA